MGDMHMLAATIFDIIVGKQIEGGRTKISLQRSLYTGQLIFHSYERATNNRIHERKADKLPVENKSGDHDEEANQAPM